MFVYPHLYHGLPGNIELQRFVIKTLYHPDREIHVDPLHHGRLLKIQEAGYILAAFELPVELFSGYLAARFALTRGILHKFSPTACPPCDNLSLTLV